MDRTMTATSPHPKTADHRVVRMRRRSGVATLWLILFIPVFLIALCVVVDVGTIWMARAELEDGLEAAAIAGVVAWEDANDPRIVPPLPGTAVEAPTRAAAIAMAAANSVRGEPIAIVNGDIALGEIPANAVYGFAVINPVGAANNSAIRIIADATVASRAIPGVNYTVQAGVIAVARGGDFYLLPSP
jgi:hypothetical protein